MKLQKQMFGLIADWYASKLVKKDFLADKNITQAKFDYWLKKHHSCKLDSTEANLTKVDSDFEEIVTPTIERSEPEVTASTKILELRTPSGLHIEVFEKC